MTQPITGKAMMMKIHQYGRPVFSAWNAKQNWIPTTIAPMIGIAPPGPRVSCEAILEATLRARNPRASTSWQLAGACRRPANLRSPHRHAKPPCRNRASQRERHAQPVRGEPPVKDLGCDRGAALPYLRRLLERVRELQHAEI